MPTGLVSAATWETLAVFVPSLIIADQDPDSAWITQARDFALSSFLQTRFSGATNSQPNAQSVASVRYEAQFRGGSACSTRPLPSFDLTPPMAAMPRLRSLSRHRSTGGLGHRETVVVASQFT